MGRHSSDSDNERRLARSSNRSRRRSSSEDSSSGSRKNRRSNKKSSRRSKSRSKDRYSRSRRSRSSSYTRSRTSRRSPSRERSKKRSKSRDRYRSRRSRSKSYIREYTSKPKRRSSSSSPESDRSKKPSKTKPQKPKFPLAEDVSETLVVIDAASLDIINDEKFVQKQFSSSKSNKVLDNIVIDLHKQTIKVPELEQVEPDSIFHHGLFGDPELRMEKWVKDLFSYRQKALQQQEKV